MEETDSLQEESLLELATMAGNDLEEERRRLFEQFVKVFVPQVPRRYRRFLSTPDLYSFLLQRFEYLTEPIERYGRVRVHSPTSGNGAEWTTNVSVVEAVLPDRPFLVDTIREHFRTSRLDLFLSIHPILTVHRTDGIPDRIEEGRTPGPREAYMYFHISRIPDPDDCEHHARLLASKLGTAAIIVDDFSGMGQCLRDLEVDLKQRPEAYPSLRSTIEQKSEFLRWILNDNFVFLGYQSYRWDGEGGFQPIEDSPRLGVFRPTDPSPAREFREALDSDVRDLLYAGMTQRHTLSIMRTGVPSIVHRASDVDCIALAEYGPEGLVKVHAIVGLFTTSALAERPTRIPLVREKIQTVLSRFGHIINSYSHKEVLSSLCALPKEYLFNSDVDLLKEEIDVLTSAEDDSDLLVSVRPHPENGRVIVTAQMPEANYTAEVRDQVLERLSHFFEPVTVRDYHCTLDNRLSRLHAYLFSPKNAAEDRDIWRLEQEITALIRTWEERLGEGLDKIAAGADARRLERCYSTALPASYKAGHDIESTVFDILKVERLRQENATQVGVYTRARPDGRDSVRIYCRSKIALSDVMPVISNLGLFVLDEEATPIRLSPEEQAFIHSFSVTSKKENALASSHARSLVAEGLIKVLRGSLENDPLLGLILLAELDWQACDLLITYRNYFHQVDRSHSWSALNEALLAHPEVARILFRYFERRFMPGVPPEDRDDLLPKASRNEALETLESEFFSAMEAVKSINEDRILRQFFELIKATLRTNFYVPRENRAIALKIGSAVLEWIPNPRPYAEIYVHGPRVEAVHLRGGLVARGGLRWSDRPDDFRMEVLGLVKTQLMKNAVIVPVGSKGGFILKGVGRDGPSRKRAMVAQYQAFINGMLDVTDNIEGGEIQPPPHVVRYDSDDPYLVVAADKGTATLSDTANEIALKRGFWLGDAFASGGSEGYSHKDLGITARGAWECAKIHFREMGRDIMVDPVRVAGIGDMSGDVFGNGLLQSSAIKLVAAFDHRHIFIDPDPDPLRSYGERKRLYDLPGSCWADYDPSLLSEGGAVYPRTQKVIHLSPRAREILDLPDSPLNGQELIKAILKMDCDLFWNGGIGTYFKSRAETNLQVGDKANDDVRVDVEDIRAKVIVEGGNLGLTQAGRVEYARRNGRINTDAIDNSGGVDLSDHEVNLKILFGELQQRKLLGGQEERNALLRGICGEVIKHVLRTNYLQGTLLTMDEYRVRQDPEPYINVIRELEEAGLVDRKADRLPTDEEMLSTDLDEGYLTRPQLAVLTGATKQRVFSELLHSDLPDQDTFHGVLLDYFPREIAERYSEVILGHRLRREIIATRLANKVVNQAGIAAYTRMADLTGASIPDITWAYMLVDDLVGGDSLREEIYALDGQVPADDQYRCLMDLSSTIMYVVSRVLTTPLSAILTQEFVARHRPGVKELLSSFQEALPENLKRSLSTARERLTADSFPEDLAVRCVAIHHLKPILTLLRIRDATQTPLVEVARMFYRIGDELHLYHLTQYVERLPLKDAWEEQLAWTMSRDLRRYLRKITVRVIRGRVEGETLEDALSRFLSDHSRAHGRLEEGYAKLSESGDQSLVAAQVLKEIYAELLLERC